MTTNVLDSVGVAINTELDLYICLPCGTAFTHSPDIHSGILRHVQHEHNGSTSAAQHHIINHSHNLIIADHYPTIKPTMAPRILLEDCATSS